MRPRIAKIKMQSLAQKTPSLCIAGGACKREFVSYVLALSISYWLLLEMWCCFRRPLVWPGLLYFCFHLGFSYFDAVLSTGTSDRWKSSSWENRSHESGLLLCFLLLFWYFLSRGSLTIWNSWDECSSDYEVLLSECCSRTLLGIFLSLILLLSCDAIYWHKGLWPVLFL